MKHCRSSSSHPEHMTAEKTWHKSTTQQSSTGILFHWAALFFWILVWSFSPIWASASHFPRVPGMSEFSSLAHSLFLTIRMHPGYLCLSPVPSHIENTSNIPCQNLYRLEIVNSSCSSVSAVTPPSSLDMVAALTPFPSPSGSNGGSYIAQLDSYSRLPFLYSVS